jgi:hypothetical protein
MLMLPKRLGLGEAETDTTMPDLLLGMRAAVTPDGSAALFHVDYLGRRPIVVLVPFAQMPEIYAEARRAWALMQHRQRLQLDHGAAGLLELCQAAIRPVSMDVLADPLTGDSLFVHQFLEHPPVVIRVAPHEVRQNLEATRAAVKRQMN